ncbi:hypothetical protein KVE30_00205 [Helicobacter pylori]|nr:hypothetical protein KVE30_00205 [Helicobacter pylori]
MKEKPFNSEQLIYLEELLSHQEKYLENKLSGFSVNDLDMQSVFRLERNRLKIAYKLLGLMSFIALILAIVLISILPLQKTEHHFVDFLNQDKHYAIIQRADKSISSNEALARSLIGAYVLNRESINRIDDKSRYELVRLQSSSKVWQRFEDLIKTQNSIYVQSHLEREVHIVNIAIYQQDNNPIASVSIAAKLLNENKLVYEKRYKIVLSYIDDKSRYELVRLQSSSKVWQRFEDLIKTQNSIYVQSHLEREVHIVNIAIYQQDNNPIASVSIAAKLLNENKLVYEKRYKIVLSYLFDTPDFDYASMPKNPTGFKITRYSITEIAPTNRGD